MSDQKRRTEIQIETHEITIIRFAKTHRIGSSEKSLGPADVVAYADVVQPSIKETEEKENENDKQT